MEDGECVYPACKQEETQLMIQGVVDVKMSCFVPSSMQKKEKRIAWCTQIDVQGKITNGRCMGP